ncbi:MBL fold metallo-hydrolase [Rhodococcus erythropolis]|uniref:MBL fold metallo-hydrolase n=1 Tax=Rhodococcus erythropolis TaxID=1833 RepID=UPI00366D7BB0
MTTSLSIDVYVTPMRPFAGAPAAGDGDLPMWSPMSATLISGETDAVLVDTLVTFDQVDALSDWIQAHGKNLVAIYITHGHADHWIGLSRLLERFPQAKAVATSEVVARAEFESTDPTVSTYWQTIFAGEIPSRPVLPQALADDVIELEGFELRVVRVARGDTEFSTVLHVPSIAAVIAGDVVYNGVHMMTAETGPIEREQWVSSLDAVAALDPRIVVAGHKRIDNEDGPETIEQTRQYLRDFSRIVAEEKDPATIVSRMLKLHGDRDNPRTLWHAARAAAARAGR